MPQLVEHLTLDQEVPGWIPGSGKLNLFVISKEIKRLSLQPTWKSQLVRTCTWKFSGNSSSYQTKASKLEKLA